MACPQGIESPRFHVLPQSVETAKTKPDVARPAAPASAAVSMTA